MCLCFRASMCSGNSLRMFSRLCVMCDLCCFWCGLWRSVSYLPWSRAISAPFRLGGAELLASGPASPFWSPMFGRFWKTLNITKCKDHILSDFVPNKMVSKTWRGNSAGAPNVPTNVSRPAHAHQTNSVQQLSLLHQRLSKSASKNGFRHVGLCNSLKQYLRAGGGGRKVV